MKVFIASAVSLLLGALIGWYLGLDHAKQETTEAVQMGLQARESLEATEAARDVRAIDLIGSGDAQQAVQLLSGPIAYYSSLHSAAGRNDELSTKLRAQIEQLSRTNQVVAARIAEASTNYRHKTP